MKMTNKELNKELNRLNSLANKRIKRLKEKGIKSPALRGMPDKFTNRGETRAEKLRDYHRVNKFVNSETSTLRGVKKTFKNILTSTGLEDVILEKTSIDIKSLDTSQIIDLTNEFFSLTSMVQDYMESKGDFLSYDKVWDYVKQEMKLDSSDDIDLDGMNRDEMLHNIIVKIHNDYLKHTHTSTLL